MKHPDINAVIDKYRNLIYAIAIGVVNDAHLAEDISQDVLLRLIKNADTLLMLEEPKLIAYISIVTKNRAIDVSKKERTQINLIEKIRNNRPISMDFMVDSTFVDDFGFSIGIRELIFKLDELEKDIIILKYGFGYTYRDIAGILEQKERYIYYKSKTAHDKLYRAIVEGGAQNE